MSKYRCPVCGSPHREPVEICRQCGQAMVETDIKPIQRKADPGVRERYRSKSVTPYIFGGLALVAVILIVAVAFGNADTEGPVDEVIEKVPGLTSDDDGWEVFEEPTGAFVVELPNEPVQQDFLDLSDQGETTAWVSPISGRMDLVVAYTNGAGMGTGDTTEVRLRPVADRFLAMTGGKYVDDPVETSFAGYPALEFEIEDYQRDGDPGHLNGLVIQVGDELVVAWTDSLEESPEQFPRLLETLEISLGAPATTVPVE
jgi:hypothetical protein